MSTFYVATNGNDNNNGAEGTPWLTVLQATGQGGGSGGSVGAGDTAYIKNGTYDSGTTPGAQEGPPAYNPASSGTAGNLKNYRVYPGHVVRLQCTTRADTLSGTPCFGGGSAGAQKDYFLWDGVRVVEGGTYKNAHIGGTGIVMENLYMDMGPRTNGTANGNYCPMYIHTTTDCIIRYSDFRNSYDTDSAGTGQCYGILSWDTTRLRVHNNDIRNCSLGFEDKRDCTDNLWELNYITGSDKHAILISDNGGAINATGMTIRYNVCSYWGEVVVDSAFLKSNWTTGNTGLVIHNNTAYGGEKGFIHAVSSDTGLRVYNNIIIPTETGSCQRWEGSSTPADYRCNYNFYTTTGGQLSDLFLASGGVNTLAEWQALTSTDNGGRSVDQDAVVDTDPEFTGTPSTSAAVTNYKLGGSSPASNAGHVGGLAAGATVNIGAYYTSDVTIGIPGQSVTGVWIV